MIAEPLSLEDHPQLESAASPQTHGEAAAEPSPSVETPPLTVASVTSSLQLILATRRAARLNKNTRES